MCHGFYSCLSSVEKTWSVVVINHLCALTRAFLTLAFSPALDRLFAKDSTLSLISMRRTYIPGVLLKKKEKSFLKI